MMPEPTTAASRNAVPGFRKTLGKRHQASRASPSGIRAADFFEFLCKVSLVERAQWQGRENADALMQHAVASLNASALSAGVPVAAAGSGTPQWAVMGCPGHTGHVSAAALSQTVKTKSNCGASGVVNSFQDFERKPDVS